MMTANGSDCGDTRRSDVVATARSGRCRSPTPAAKAIGNERKLATSAAAIAASTRFVIVETCSVTIGATRIAASPARPEPSDQLTTAMRSGEIPTVAAARWFSADRRRRHAELRVPVAAPTAPTLSTAAIPSRMKRSIETALPNGWTSVGRQLGVDERHPGAVADHGDAAAAG